MTLGSAGVLGSLAVQQLSAGSLSRAHLLAIAASGVLLGPTLVRNCQWYGPIVRGFSTDQREVWLTIDDGPDPQNTPEILDLLTRYNATATFFCIGEKIAKWPHLAKAIAAEGHQLQNHTFTHPTGSFWAATPKRARQEIERCRLIIADTVGITPTQFRTPVGLSNPFVHAEVERAGLSMIGWSIAALDGIPHEPNRVVQKILHSFFPGGIILLHEGALCGMPQGTRARTLESILQGLEAQGFSTVIPAPASLRER